MRPACGAGLADSPECGQIRAEIIFVGQSVEWAYQPTWKSIFTSGRVSNRAHRSTCKSIFTKNRMSSRDHRSKCKSLFTNDRLSNRPHRPTWKSVFTNVGVSKRAHRQKWKSIFTNDVLSNGYINQHGNQYSLVAGCRIGHNDQNRNPYSQVTLNPLVIMGGDHFRAENESLVE